MSEFKTLVLSGGGIYGYTMLGCLAHLHENGLLLQVENYVGTSIGAVIGYLMALGCSPLEVIINFNREKVLNSLAEFDVMAMANGAGACSWDHIQKHLERVTIDRLGEYVNLRDLRDKYGKTLVCTTFNLDTQTVEYMGPDSHPSMPALVAVRMSANVPLLFDVFKYQGGHYVDGGILDNLPIEYALRLMGLEQNPDDAEKARRHILAVSMDYLGNHKPPKEWTLMETIYSVMMAPIMSTTREKIATCRQYSTLYRLRPHDGIKFFHFNITSGTALDLFSEGYNDARDGGTGN